MIDSAWDDAFHDLWLHTVRHRGLITGLAELPGPIRDSTMPAWPRTRGADVLAIASVVAPVLRALPRQPGSHGIDRLWRSCACDIADHAVAKPDREYAQNRTFWATLAEVAAYLASIDAAIPQDMWRALLAEIAGPRDHRDARIVRDDYLQVMAASYDGLWQAQKDALARLRGADVCEPIGHMRGPRMAIPRTTLSDVLHLADFWTDAMHLVEPKANHIPAEAFATLGYNAVRRHWYAALAALDHEAEVGEPEDLHTNNHEFWRAAAVLATVLAVIDEAPSKLDRALDGVITGSRNADGIGAPGEVRNRAAGDHDQMWQTQKAALAQLRGADTFDPLVRNADTIKEGAYDLIWSAQRAEYEKQRGFDLRDPLPGKSGRPMKVPRTTNADILKLASYWSDAWAKLAARWATGSLVNPIGLDAERTRWQAAVQEVEQYAKPGNPDELYPRNHEFWRATSSLSITLAIFKEAPTPYELMFDSTVQAVKDLPGRIADAAGAVATAVGNIAHEAGAGLLKGLGPPLLIGGGVLLGAYLLFRNRPHEASVVP